MRLIEVFPSGYFSIIFQLSISTQYIMKIDADNTCNIAI